MVVFASLLTAFAGMLHGSHIGARLDGPKGWTGWVVLDLLLAAAPVGMALVVFASLAFEGSKRRALDRALISWLAVAGISCVLAGFWI